MLKGEVLENVWTETEGSEAKIYLGVKMIPVARRQEYGKLGTLEIPPFKDCTVIGRIRLTEDFCLPGRQPWEFVLKL